mgnify:CR=1 FL=1
MATSEEIEKYCRNCVSRDFVNEKDSFVNVPEHFPLLKKNVTVLSKIKNWKD